MTENEESLDKQQADELHEHFEIIDSIVKSGDATRALVKVAGRIAITLLRLTHAQEKLVALAEIDLQETIEAEIKSRAETMAEEMVEEKSKRGFIGQRKS